MSGAFPSVFTKEVRALLPLWVVSVLAMVVARLSIGLFLPPQLALFAYVIGAAVLGAMAIGHEYGHGTLGILLSQPIERRRLLTAKAAALALLLIALALAARLLAFSPAAILRVGTGSRWFIPIALLLPALLAFSFAPWMTMLTRNAIAGAVFTVSVPGVLLIAGQLIGFRLQGYASASDRVASIVLLVGTGIISAAGLAGEWGRFLRLEAVEGTGREFNLPERALSSGAYWDAELARRHPLSTLVRKEFRLQQLPIAVAVFYCAGALTLIPVANRYSGGQTALTVLMVMGAAMTVALAGALSSAEERQLGTLDVQLLLPLSAWKQWTIKMMVLVILAFITVILIPVTIAWIRTGTPWPTLTTVTDERVLLAIVFVLASGVYVSSLSSSSIRAFVWSLPVIFGVPMFVNGFHWFVIRPLLGFRIYATYASSRASLVALAAAAVLGVYVAFLNHREMDRSGRRLAGQAAWMTALFVAVVFVMLGV